MKIGVNTLFFIPGEVGGSETYLRETLKALVKLKPAVKIVLFTNLENEASLRQDLEGCASVSFEQLRFRASNRYSRIIREQIELPVRVKRSGVDVLWSPGYTAPFFCSVPQVVSILDMQYKHHPEDFSWSYLAATHFLVCMSARRANRIIAISEFSKSEIMKYTGQSADKIDAVLLAADKSFSLPVDAERRRQVLSKYGIGNVPYILCVANSYPHKQVHILIEAFGRIINDIPHRLVIVGKPRKGEVLVQESMRNLPDKVRVARLDYVDRADLSALYQASALFAFPSVYEGFGLPVLEAMMSRVPVLACRKASIPEVGGEGIDYCQPDPAGIAAGIMAILERAPEEKDAKLALAMRIAEKFSWDRCASGVLQSLIAATGK